MELIEGLKEEYKKLKEECNECFNLTGHDIDDCERFNCNTLKQMRELAKKAQKLMERPDPNIVAI